MKLTFILCMTFLSSLGWAKQAGCIAYHPKGSLGITSAAHEVICSNETFIVSAPIDALWLFGDKEERMLVDDLKAEMKQRKNLVAVASMKPIKDTSRSDATTVHVFVKEDSEEKRIYCTLIKFKERTIGALGSIHKVKNMVAKCPGMSPEKLTLVTEEMGNQFMSEHGLEKDFELKYETEFDPGENFDDPQSSSSIAVYSMKI